MSSDSVRVVGSHLDEIIAFFETHKDRWKVHKYNDCIVHGTREYNTWMLEVVDGIVVKCHYQGLTYTGKSVAENGDKYE